MSLSKLIAVLLLAGALTCCAAGKPYQPEGSAMTIRPRGMIERCYVVPPGGELKYSFSASMPVDFNVHYHEGEKVVYSVEETGVRDYESSLVSLSKKKYCLMWKNPHHLSVNIIYRAPSVAGESGLP